MEAGVSVICDPSGAPVTARSTMDAVPAGLLSETDSRKVAVPPWTMVRLGVVRAREKSSTVTAAAGLAAAA